MTLAKLLTLATAAGLIAAPAAEAQHFNWTRTEHNHSILIESALLNGNMLQLSDEIAVFDPDGVCAGGIVIVNPDEEIGLAAWGDDDLTDVDEGFEADDPFEFRYWIDGEEREYVVDCEVTEGPDSWQNNGLTILNLDYEGEPPPRYWFEHDFGLVIVGQQADWECVVDNIGDSQIWIYNAEVDGEYFSVQLPDSGLVIEADSQDSILVSFRPEEREHFGGLLTLYISIHDDEEDWGEVYLSGRGIFPPRLELDRWEINFGYAQVDSSPRYGTGEDIIWDTLRVANGGDRDLVLSDFGFDHPEDFGLPDDFPDSLTVEPSDTITIPIYFNPTEEGDYDSRFLFTCNDPDHFISSVRLLGSGTMPIWIPDDQRATEVTGFAITSLYPNPLNNYVTIGYSVPELTEVSVEITTVTGRRVTLLQRGFQAAGEHRVVWSGMDSRGGSVASGAYLVRVSGGGDVAIARVLLQR
jgi:hypothetical protein